ncbi:MAG: PDZ domain-containing protein [Pirellulales bacterium]
MGSRSCLSRLSAIVACAVLCGAASLAATPQPDQPAPRGVLDLRGGGFVSGELVPAPEAGDGRETLLWQSPLFTKPFEFRLADVTGVRFGTARDPGKPSADAFRLHLRGGDIITGVVQAIDSDTVTVEAVGGAGRQTLQIRRDEVESIARRSAGGGSFDGPGGLAGWEQKPGNAWREEAGRLLTSRRGSSISRDVAAPPRARYDIGVSWTMPAEFRFSLVSDGVAGDDQFMLELLRPAAGGPTLAVVRRKSGKATLEPISLDPAADSLRIVLFVDQPRGRMAVVLPAAGDQPAADIELARGADAEPLRGVRLSLTSGDICLENLRVTPWTAAEPTLDAVEQTRIALRNGDPRTGEIEGFDSQGGTFMVREAGQVTRIPAADVTEISLPRAEATGPQQVAQVRAIGANGDVVSGSLVNVDTESVWIRRQGLAEPLSMPFPQLVALQSLVPAATALGLPGREGRLEGDGFAMRGAVAAVSGGVGWQPAGSISASPFAATAAPFSGRLDYVAAPADTDESGMVGGIGGMVSRADDGGFVVTMLAEDGAAAQDGRLQPGDRIVAIAPAERARFVPTKGLEPDEVTDLLRGQVGTPVRIKVTDAAGEDPRTIELVRGRLAMAGGQLLRQALETHAELAAPESAGDVLAFPYVVVLTSGESTPCRVVAIDAERLKLVTPLAGTAEEPVDVPATRVKAVEFDPSVPGRALDRVRFERLLTIPRMQRSRPPTHVLRLKNGDYVRGRLIAADDKTVRIELPGKEQVFPRDAVARAIWLHPEELDPQADAIAAEPPRPQGLEVTGIWPGGRRVALMAEAVEGQTIQGTHAAFGKARIHTDRVERLLFGTAAEKGGDQRPYSQWKVRPAPEPRALREQEPAKENTGA